ncbi:hypothetical protein ISF_04919 [Cordyceps fumosorosea ARSEF 2679]|uniref:Uncharacterized protein n=1 Tax=Cordyceps fumosorosea (strain ARSEF 2679) TaxID=1081104 RepID=A0A167VW41_CORFA|nr:hypothetical protein ISF_04919 [Cordyceps fumosorosea ARSEF 2679]OAA63043.1 hypothetical protein ISF_04919 [Cordyceps fumosorosea ARSEF 2679]
MDINLGHYFQASCNAHDFADAFETALYRDTEDTELCMELMQRDPELAFRDCVLLQDDAYIVHDRRFAASPHRARGESLLTAGVFLQAVAGREPLDRLRLALNLVAWQRSWWDMVETDIVADVVQFWAWHDQLMNRYRLVTRVVRAVNTDYFPDAERWPREDGGVEWRPELVTISLVKAPTVYWEPERLLTDTELDELPAQLRMQVKLRSWVGWTRIVGSLDDDELEQVSIVLEEMGVELRYARV